MIPKVETEAEEERASSRPEPILSERNPRVPSSFEKYEISLTTIDELKASF
jgi:hypothetical protein